MASRRELNIRKESARLSLLMSKFARIFENHSHSFEVADFMIDCIFDQFDKVLFEKQLEYKIIPYSIDSAISEVCQVT